MLDCLMVFANGKVDPSVKKELLKDLDFCKVSAFGATVTRISNVVKKLK